MNWFTTFDDTLLDIFVKVCDMLRIQVETSELFRVSRCDMVAKQLSKIYVMFAFILPRTKSSKTLDIQELEMLVSL